MNVTAKPLLFALGILVLATSCSTPTNSNTSLLVAGGTPPTIKIDGSSTVFPITDAIAKQYNQTKADKINIQAAFSGTTARVCQVLHSKC